MPRMRQKQCAETGCLKQPSFNLPTESQGLFCYSHSKDGMVDVKNPKCAYSDCAKFPSFNASTEKKGRFCVTHKEEGMIDVKNKRCAEVACTKQPYFNFPLQKKGLFCGLHRIEGMVNVVSKSCAEADCSTQPTFNLPTEKYALYCAVHKTMGMVDVKNYRCVEDGCNVRAKYNAPSATCAIYCTAHKKDGMIHVMIKRCVENDCSKMANFNFEGITTPLYCSLHKKDSMIDVLNPVCLAMHCSTRVSNVLYKNYCVNCFINLYPDETISRQYKIKEKHYTDIIKETFPDIAATYDRRIQGGCSLRRPDFFVDLGAFTLHVEIDEFDHRYRDTTCETAKINDTFTDLADRPMVLLRTNPDAYIDEKGVQQKGCFKPHKKTGILIVADKIELKKRTDLMVERIRYWLERAENNDPPTEPITIEYQFTSRQPDICDM